MTKFKSQDLDIKKSNDKKLVGVATLSFPPNGTLAFYVINRQLATNILVPRSKMKYQYGIKHLGTVV